MMRDDVHAPAKPGYEPTGQGFWGECPDHASHLMWDARGFFFCPVNEHQAEPYVIAEADVYVEHDEAWRVVLGCLWVDQYDPLEEGVSAADSSRNPEGQWTSQVARDAEAARYGDESYWAYLERKAVEYAERFPERADYFLSRSLSEALAGNVGE